MATLVRAFELRRTDPLRTRHLLRYHGCSDAPQRDDADFAPFGTGLPFAQPDFAADAEATGTGGTTNVTTQGAADSSPSQGPSGESSSDTESMVTTGSTGGTDPVTSGLGSSSADPPSCETSDGDGPIVEICNGLDDDCDGLIDEVSERNSACMECFLEQQADRAWYVCAIKLDWQSARSFCQAFGADLISVRDGAENGEVAMHLASLQPPTCRGRRRPRSGASLTVRTPTARTHRACA